MYSPADGLLSLTRWIIPLTISSAGYVWPFRPSSGRAARGICCNRRDSNRSRVLHILCRLAQHHQYVVLILSLSVGYRVLRARDAPHRRNSDRGWIHRAHRCDSRKASWQGHSEAPSLFRVRNTIAFVLTCDNRNDSPEFRGVQLDLTLNASQGGGKHCPAEVLRVEVWLPESDEYTGL